jgi:hypothetical protein
MDIADIAAAIATRFGNLTPPTGYVAIQKSTPKRQSTVGKLPIAETAWASTHDLTYGFGRREGVADFTTTVLFPKAKDEPTTDAMLQAWHDVLIDALLGQVQLGEWGTSNGVRGAYVRSVTPGEDQRGEPYLAALLVTIEVDFEHAIDIAA